MRLFLIAAFFAMSFPALAENGLSPFEKRFIVEFDQCSVSRLEMGSGVFSTVPGAPVALMCEAGENLAVSCILQAEGGIPVNIHLTGGKTKTQAIVRSADGSFQALVDLISGVAMLRTDFDVRGLSLRGVKTCGGRYRQEGESAPANDPKPPLVRPKRVV